MSQHALAVLFGDTFAVMNTIGLVAFALVGASKAIREEFDLFGIAIVETIVNAHGWEVQIVESEAGGARFEITGVDIEEA